MTRQICKHLGPRQVRQYSCDYGNEARSLIETVGPEGVRLDARKEWVVMIGVGDRPVITDVNAALVSKRLAEIRAREQAATPGPWTGDPEPCAIYIYGADDNGPVADTHVPGKRGNGDPEPDPEGGERAGVDAVLRLRGAGASKHRPEGSMEANYAFMIHARDDVRWLLDLLGVPKAP